MQSDDEEYPAWLWSSCICAASVIFSQLLWSAAAALLGTATSGFSRLADKGTLGTELCQPHAMLTSAYKHV